MLKVKAQAGKAEIFLYGYIGYECTAGEFLKELRALENSYTDICVRINSQGGEVFQGFPIYNAIRMSKATIEVYVDGLAASMASVIMLAGKKIYIASNARVMVHGPEGGDYTTVENLENVVKMMKDLRQDMAKAYAGRTGKTEQWVMDNWLTDGKDHWFTAQQAKAEGLVDEIYYVEDAEIPSASWELPRIAAFYNERLSEGAPAPKSDKTTVQQTEISMKKVIAALTESNLVQLPETSTEELVAEGARTIVNRLRERDEAIAEKDREISALKAKLQEAQTASLKERAETLVSAAVTAGKIVAAQKDNYVKLASAGEEGFNNVKAVLDSMQPYKSVSNQINNTTQGGGAQVQYASLKDEFEKRAEDGSLESLKATNFEHFKAVYKAGLGKDYNG